MLLDFDFPGKDIFKAILRSLTRSWGLVLIAVFSLNVLLAVRLAVSNRINNNVLERMAVSGQQQVDTLHKEIFRLERQGELYKRRIHWMEQSKKEA